MKTSVEKYAKYAPFFLLLLAVVLVAWKVERGQELRETRQLSAFRERHYYTLWMDDSTKVGCTDTREEAYALIETDSVRLDKELELARGEQFDLHYYLMSHGVQDEGYDMIAAYSKKIDHKVDSLKDLCARTTLIRSGAKFRIEHCVNYLSAKPNPLPPNVKVDYNGTYTGEMDEHKRANGHGRLEHKNGDYYEGSWKDNLRDGFGFFIAPGKPMQVGEWKLNVFLGERVNYHSDRIYGIDVSKYQHIHGKKKYPIYWSQLRISHLGTLSKKTVSGTVDYPVSFAFIKSTEGSSVKNPYYAADYRAARRQGIPVGTYHFFSVKSAASAQANYFLSNSYLQSGDLPPVLDVEPTRRQIEDIGGPTELFNRIRTWMRIVERRAGVKPILYVNQTFVNRYLSQAPDIKSDYLVWIARYGEYKPDVKLAFWQLCPDGRVKGITGEVDINVFNGYRDKYDEFLKKYKIK